MANYSSNKDVIIALVLANKEILEVEISGKSEYFLIEQFEKSSVGSVQSSPYFYVVGYDITRLLLNHVMNSSIVDLTSKLDKIQSQDKPIRYEFSDSHVWRNYGRD